MALNTVLNYPSFVEIEWTLIRRAGNKPKALNHGWRNLRALQTSSLGGRSSLQSPGNNPCQPPCKVPEAWLLRGITPLLSRLEVRAMITAQSNLKEKVSGVKNILRKNTRRRQKKKKNRYCAPLGFSMVMRKNLLQNIKFRFYFHQIASK